MAQTLEQLNAVRERIGQEPLTELPGAPASPEAGSEGEKKVEAKEEKPVVAAPIELELDDDKVLKYLNSKGISATKLDDLTKPVTEADLQKQADERENAKLTYGLNKGLFNRKTHEQFILDSSNKRDLVYAHYYQEAKQDDPALSDEDIQSEFAQKYGLDTEPNTRKHKRGQQEIELLAERILQNKYANIYKLDSEYDSYESQQNSQKAQAAKVIAAAPAYKEAVESVFSELKKITTKLGENEEYEVEASEEALAELKGHFLASDYAAKQILAGYTKEEIKELAQTAFLSRNWPSLAKQMINQALLQHQKGVKGISPVNITPGAGAPDNQLSEEQKRIRQRIFPSQPVGAN